MAHDQFGNWVSGAAPASNGELPNSGGGLLHGDGGPDADLGRAGSGYVNVLNGNFYIKDNTGWHLQSGGGGGSIDQIIATAQANPNSPLITPDDPTKGAIFTQNGLELTNVWRWDTGLGNWQGLLG